MTMASRTLPTILAFGLFSCALAQAASDPAADAAGAGAPAVGTEFPARFRANIVAMGGPGPGGTARLLLILDRWSTVEERQAMMNALKEGGQDALVAQMEKADMGRISINESLGWPVRLASMRKTARGEVIRIATDRPIAIIEGMESTRSKDYQIGFMEFTISADGKTGEGTMNLATRVKLDESGDIVIESLPGNTAPQQLLNVRREAVKKKKPKKE